MFMNRVHEQCPKNDSGKIPSRTGPKTGRVYRVHSPRPARAPRPPSQPCPPHTRACYRALPRSPCAPATRAPVACALAARPAHLQRARSPSAQRLLRPAATCAPHARPARAQHLPSAPALCHNTTLLTPLLGRCDGCRLLGLCLLDQKFSIPMLACSF